MNLFLDSSVVLAACGSEAGASSEVCRRASSQGWSLIVTPYVVAEVEANISNLPASADAIWRGLNPKLQLHDDIFTIDRPAIFGAAKDRPILFSALAWADILLTLDRADFGALMDQEFYGLRVLRPGSFLEEQRTAGRLR